MIFIQQIALAYEEFWTGLSWREAAPNDWQQIPNGYGFINRETGRLIPAFPDRAPTPAAFPFIIYPSNMPNSMASIITNFSILDRRPAMFNFQGLTNDVVGQFEKYCPPETGLEILVPDRGIMWINRGSAFVQYLADESDPAITRAIVSLEYRGIYY